MSCSKLGAVVHDLSRGSLLKDYGESDSDDETYEQNNNSEGNESASESELEKYPRGKVIIHNRPSKGKMTKLKIKGIPVEFPGKPYPSQIRMMKCVIKGLEGSKNNLIESPTGTGKTLALLCSVLAWKKARNFKGKIYYTTRTHSQVSGVIKELNKTIYSNVNTTILGSRKQFCINSVKPVFGKEGEENKVSVDAFCRKLRLGYSIQKAEEKKSCKSNNDESEDSEEEDPSPKKKKRKCKKVKSCNFYHGKETGKLGDNALYTRGRTLDLEDYKKHGVERHVCPYYVTMYRHSDAELSLCPYNYIISRQLRKSCKIDLEDSLVIFDEGHNLEKACCDEASLSIRANVVLKTAESCSAAIRSAETPLPETVEIELKYLENVLKKLSSLIVENSRGQSVSMNNNEIIFQKFDKIGLGKENISQLNESLKFIQEQEGMDNEIYLNMDVASKIRRILWVLKLLYSHCAENGLKDYQLFFPNDIFSDATLEIKCMNAAVVFKEIEEATTSVTITSGTLAPLASFPRELDSEFLSESLEQSIPSSRYHIVKVPQGPRKRELHIIASKRSQKLILREIGNAVLKICEIVPNGVIFFCSSASYLNELLNYWEKFGILKKIKKYKHVFSESNKNVQNVEAEYKAKSKNPGKKGSKTGALLLAYFRGTISEGVDFKDEEARAVITVGIPLMPLRGPEASARRMYYSDNSKFDQWYNTDAFRAFNQGIGRCVRHSQDWGAVIMLESRLLPQFGCRSKYDEYLPGWIRKACINYVRKSKTQDVFGEMVHDLKQFVDKMIGEDENSSVEEDENIEESGEEEEGSEESEEAAVEDDESEDDSEETEREDNYSRGRRRRYNF